MADKNAPPRPVKGGPTAEELSTFEAKYQRIAHVIGAGESWHVVFRKPTRQEYKQFKARLSNPQQAPDAQEILTRNIVVWPSTEQYDALLEDYPGIPEACSDALMKLAGMRGDEEAK